MSELRIYRFPEHIETPYKHVKLYRDTSSFKVEKALPQEHEGRMSESLSRSRRLIQEYILCNHFDLFCTFTFDKAKVRDRHDYKELKKQFSKFLNNYKNRHDKNFKYLYIPELHKDGAVHFHGVMTMPYYLCSHREIYVRIGGVKRKVPNKKGYMDWRHYSERFGHFSCSWIRDNVRCAVYVSKYMTKDLAQWFERNGQIVMHSKGLARPELVFVESDTPIPGQSKDSDFKGEFCEVAMRDILETSEVYFNADDNWHRYADDLPKDTFLADIRNGYAPFLDFEEVTEMPDCLFPMKWREYGGIIDNFEQLEIYEGGAF